MFRGHFTHTSTQMYSVSVLCSLTNTDILLQGAEIEYELLLKDCKLNGIVICRKYVPAQDCTVH